jgi:hypothetical protein
MNCTFRGISIDWSEYDDKTATTADEIFPFNSFLPRRSGDRSRNGWLI